ncbi:MAG: glucosamine-6-phosphate deaminase [Clostridia bacterium]|nr:glucosamine-6-phosphate deaminase [Clostridia bacterium]
MELIIVKDYAALSQRAANLIQAQLTWNPQSVLGLATGSTPVGMYDALVKMYQDKAIDFSQVTTFNLDEYLGLGQDNPQSYYAFMHEHLFKHINVNKEKIHIPNGLSEDIQSECLAYEKSIQLHGGIDLQVLGIGHNGHIGFNEPNVEFEAKTHVVSLDQETIEANKRFFDSIEDVPKKAISMGIKTIMKSKRIVLLASGEGKADIIAKLVKDEISPNVPASVLHLHENVVIIVDEAAASKL